MPEDLGKAATRNQSSPIEEATEEASVAPEEPPNEAYFEYESIEEEVSAEIAIVEELVSAAKPEIRAEAWIDDDYDEDAFGVGAKSENKCH